MKEVIKRPINIDGKLILEDLEKHDLSYFLCKININHKFPYMMLRVSGKGLAFCDLNYSWHWLTVKSLSLDLEGNNFSFVPDAVKYMMDKGYCVYAFKNQSEMESFLLNSL